MINQQTVSPKPLCTIITVVFNLLSQNREQRFKKTIEQVAKLKIPYEHLIMDGASTDGTTQYCQELAQQYPYLKVYSSPDKGIYDAMNKGIARANGHFLYFCNSDDFIEDADAFEGAVQLAYQKNIALLISPVWSDTASGRVLWPSAEKKLRRILFRMCYSHQGVLLQTTVAKRLGGFDTSYALMADCHLLLRVMLHSNENISIRWIPYANFGQDGISSNPTKLNEELIALLKDALHLSSQEATSLAQQGIAPWRIIFSMTFSSKSILRKAARFMMLRRLHTVRM